MSQPQQQCDLSEAADGDPWQMRNRCHRSFQLMVVQKCDFLKLHLVVWIKLSIRDTHKKKKKHAMVSPSFSASIRTFFRATISSDLVSRARSALRKGNWLFTEHVTWTNWSVSPQYFLCCLTYTQCHMFLLLFGWVSQTLWHFCSSQTEERKTR